MTTKRSPLVVVDYGLGNLFSISRALRHLGQAEIVVSREPATVETAARVILPGVGAFGDGMRGLRENGLVPALRAFAASGRPLLGICLGMQLLMEEGTEFGVHEGLGIVPGRSVPLPRTPAHPVKIPHVGWNSLKSPRGGWDGSALAGLDAGTQVYFVHSYAAAPSREGDWLARTDYGGAPFCSALARGGVVGCQFHPERSGPAGLKILANFLKMEPTS